MLAGVATTSTESYNSNWKTAKKINKMIKAFLMEIIYLLNMLCDLGNI